MESHSTNIIRNYRTSYLNINFISLHAKFVGFAGLISIPSYLTFMQESFLCITNEAKRFDFDSEFLNDHRNHNH